MSATPRLLHALPPAPSPKRRLAPSLTPDNSWYGEEYDLLRCPVCQHDYCHIGDVSHRPTEKGSRLVVSVWAECGHAFDIVVLQHKGQSFAAVENIRRSLEEEWPL